MLDPLHITAVILAGGRGLRMQGADKGLLPLWGQPLVSHLLGRLTPQVGQVLINANRNLEHYRGLAPVIPDDDYHFAGPLAGFQAGLNHAPSEWVLFVPCDSPLVPDDLAARLCAAVHRHDDIAVVDDGARLHTATALIHQSLLPSLCNYLDGGDRKLQLWYERHRLIPVDFSDEADAFDNLNTPQALLELENKGE
ncbi:molybdenum cofactor guanylyltransferase [Oceanimonas baumannii]|uniref:molybdenum cofactor guanylyltransferase MobA n=1 Tax=Oceanimonas baumannii TaxID=129578 RepID=UPI001D18D157|nr:molybdenum cofactor guanylyltransferase MobA [Oceanimonas baumannii]MCC4265620.1 molybdenum cofactor guanylyltransferase [Oceanimonas baumannii]